MLQILIAQPANDLADLEQLSTDELEQRLNRITHQLSELADYHILGGVGPIGYRSRPHQRKDDLDWVAVELNAVEYIDRIVLVPSLWRSTRKGPQADAFPPAFELRVTQPNGVEHLVAKFTEEDQLLPRIAPLIIDIPPQPATRVRLIATALTARAWDNVECLQLSEILIFSGRTNVALHQPVTSASSEDSNARNSRYLVDGFMPYLMGLNTGKKSTAFLVNHETAIPPEITIDLGAPYPIHQINLHAIESSDTIPQSVPSDYGFPRKLELSGSLQPDFSDAEELFTYEVNTMFDLGPILSKRFPITNCRYIKLRVLEPYSNPNNNNYTHTLALAEIEIISGEKNLALGKEASSNIIPIYRGRQIGALTDGRNFYGDIIPTRDWLEQLALRHDLERERPLVEQELRQHYARQKTILNQLIWLVLLIILIATFVTALIRLMAQRSIQRTRERIAADLHDELGANLHAIGLLSDLTQKSKNNPEKLSRLLQRIRNLTTRTGAAARHCTNMLEAEELYSDVAEHFERCSRRLLTDMEYDLKIDGEKNLMRLTPRRRIDLCLFYQECLTNILRHSEASKVQAHLFADRRHVELTITDNGKGLARSQADQIPKSISRRSRLLGSKVRVETPENGGTRIGLTLKLKGLGSL